MEHNSNIDNLLISYLLNESEETENAIVESWIIENEQNRHYFDQLKKTCRLIAVNKGFENINIEDEWDIFEREIRRREGTSAVGLDPFKGIHFQKDERISKPRLSMFVAMAAAAAFIVIVGLGVFKYLYNSPVEQTTLVHVEEQKTTAPRLRHEFNIGDQPRKLMLKDGSETLLDARSEVAFYDPFEVDKKNIKLIGKANFKVAKDKARPFTVTSGDLRTTALGTNFTITAYKNSGTILVRLYEGKVVVQSGELVKRKLPKPVYLLPGYELVYNTLTATAKVRTFSENKVPLVRRNITIVDKPVVDNPSIPLYDKGSWYMFNNQSLVQVFNQLSEMYEADIVFNKKELEKLYFIGKFNKSDSLENIIHQIAALNNLKVEMIGNKYIISKQ